MARTEDNSGFTLVELMIVVLIIGILLSMAVPVFLNATELAHARTCQANQRIILSAVQTAHSIDADTSSVGSASAVLDVGSGWGNVLLPGYIMKPPVCQADGGGLYNLSVAGDPISDRGANQTTFINAGGTYDHRLSDVNP